MGRAHKVVPLTLALCLGAAANMPGTIAAQALATSGKKAEGGADP
jgi:2-methylaconitate cis-trans-isomerase PrpF